MDAAHMGADLERVLVTEEEIQARLGELAGEIATEYEGKDLLLVGVLKGAVMVMADLMRALPMTVPGRLDGRVVLRLGHEVQRCRAHPQGPRRRHHRPPRAHRRGHRRLGADPVVDQAPTSSRAAPPPSRSAPCCASRMPRRSPSTSAGWASTSPTSSSSATASTTPRRTGGCSVVGTLAAARLQLTAAPRGVEPRPPRRNTARTGLVASVYPSRRCVRRAAD